MKDKTTYLIQCGLKSLGFDPGKLDGDDGPKTRGARKAWEDSLNTDIDGDIHISTEGLELVKEFEGLYLKAYDDGGGVITIGYGHTGLTHNDGTVKKGMVITESEADRLLAYDMRKFELSVSQLVTVPLSQNEYDALVSFQFNTGSLAISSLLRKLNNGDAFGAADEFLRWVYDKENSSKPLAGLVRRRKSERNLFLGIRPFLVK